jgi:hypothetical protein
LEYVECSGLDLQGGTAFLLVKPQDGVMGDTPPWGGLVGDRGFPGHSVTPVFL